MLALATSPERLREMDSVELQALSAEIRRFLISSVAETGGHLGLEPRHRRGHDRTAPRVLVSRRRHRVGHGPPGLRAQARHRPTGGVRRAAPARWPLRLPNRSESAHDLVENSHASTALSYAYGLAASRRLRRDKRRVVAVVGDGALTGGVAYEALNNIGTSGANVVVVLNDNGRSYAPTVSRLSSAPPGPPASPVSGAPGDLDDPAAAGDSPASDFFEALGLGYLGPIDGHDLDDAPGGVAAKRRPGRGRWCSTSTRSRAAATSRPRRDKEKCLHDIGPFDTDTGVALAARPGRLSYTEAFGSALVREAAARPEIVAITAAMPGPTGLIGFRERYPDRCFDVGIAEQHAVNAAAGMAMGGLRPVVAIYSTFLNRAWDQIYYDVGLHQLPVDLLPRPRRHHRRRRPEPPRRARPDAAHEGSRDDGLRPVLVRGGRQHAAGGAGHHLGPRGYQVAEDGRLLVADRRKRRPRPAKSAPAPRSACSGWASSSPPARRPPGS